MTISPLPQAAHQFHHATAVIVKNLLRAPEPSSLKPRAAFSGLSSLPHCGWHPGNWHKPSLQILLLTRGILPQGCVGGDSHGHRFCLLALMPTWHSHLVQPVCWDATAWEHQSVTRLLGQLDMFHLSCAWLQNAGEARTRAKYWHYKGSKVSKKLLHKIFILGHW